VRILVTGVTGQVGFAVVRRFGELGTLVAADRSMLDLSRPQDIARTLDALQPDVIVNPAGYTAVDRAEDDAELAFLVNAAGPAALAQWAASRRVPLVHFSTDYVFDGSSERPWRENDKPAPLSVYGSSKLAGEEAVRSANGPHLIVRTSWVYAASGRNFLRTIARLACEQEEMRIVADQIGSPTSADMLANVLADIFCTQQADLSAAFASVDNLLHIAAAGHTTWHGFAEAIVTGLKDRGVRIATRRIVPIATKDYPTRARRPRNSRLDLTRLSDAFGIVPESWAALLASEMDRLVQNRG
jgi:dTDP-4-dehydrorhamnose reductase